MTLIDFMVGISIGLLVVLAAVGSLVMLRSSANTISGGAALEQQATLVMMQIGQQIGQAGATNAYLTGSNPNTGIISTESDIPNTTNITVGGKINFDTRSSDPSINPVLAVSGTSGDDTHSDTLQISYVAPNDGSLAANCIGNQAVAPNENSAPIIVSYFTVKTNASNANDPGDLVCGVDKDHTQPIASQVIDMRVQYLFLDASGHVSYKSASQVTDWVNVNGVQVCIEMQGTDIVKTSSAPTITDCKGNSIPSIDNGGHAHRIIKQAFYLRNV